MIWFHQFEGVYCAQHNYLGWELNFSIRSPRFFLNTVYTVSINTNRWEKLGWKTGYAIILASKTKWVSSQLFVCDRDKHGPLGRRHLHYLFITELLLFWPVGYMNPHLTDWVTEPSQVPWTGNLPICQVVYISIFCLHTLLSSSGV